MFPFKKVCHVPYEELPGSHIFICQKIFTDVDETGSGDQTV